MGGPRRPVVSWDWTKNPSLTSSIGNVTLTFTRTTPRTIADYEGMIRTILSGEAGFEGYRRVRNIAGEDLTTWPSSIGGTGSAPVVTAGFTAPDGSATAYRVQCDPGAGGTGSDHSFISANTSFTGSASDLLTHSVAVWLKSNTGVDQTVLLRHSGAGAFATVTATSEWQRLAIPNDVTLTGNDVHCCTIGARGSINPQAIDVLAWRPQHENTTGAANKNPSEYVSRGVLSTPYHGAGVDGVRYFTTYNPNTVADNVVTENTAQKWLRVPGTSGNWATTPDSTQNSITGDIDVRVKVALDDWTPSSSALLMSKWTGDPDRAWELFVNTNGTLGFVSTPTGLSANSVGGTSTVAVSAAGGTVKWVRVTLDVDDGAGNRVYKFYTSDDGVTWTQLGSTVTTAGTTSIFDTTFQLSVGAQGAGGFGAAVGAFYYAELRNGIDGTVVSKFDPSRAATLGTSFVAETGETWTINQSGAVKAEINGGAIHTVTTIKGFASWPAVQNVCLQSEDFGTTWSTLGSPTRSAAAKRCGDVVLDLLGDDDAAANEAYLQPITFTGDAVKAISTHVAQGTATNSVFQIRDTTAAANRLNAEITWSGGVPSIAMTTGTHEGTDALGNGVFRLRFQSLAVTAANTNEARVFPANTAAGDVTKTGDIYVGGVQAENDTKCGPYAKTTTGAVTVNADHPDLSTLTPWFNPVEGTLELEVVAGLAPGAGVFPRTVSINNNTTAEEIYLGPSNADNGARMFIIDGGVAVGGIQAGFYTAGAIARLVGAYKVDDAAASLNGAASVADATVATLPTVDRLMFGRAAGASGYARSYLRKFAYYAYRIPNADIERLSA